MGERPPAPGGTDRRLVSWKAIAGYLGVSVRTAQKWERQRALPVHRMPGRRGTVYANTNELDAWAAAGGRAAATWHSSRWLLWMLPAFAALVLAAGVAAYRHRGEAQPHSWSFTAGALEILDEDGRIVWRKPLPPQPANRFLSPSGSHPQIQIADLDGDGANEVVVGYSAAEPLESRVECYSATGELRWSYRPGRRVRTPQEEFSHSYDFRAVVVIPGRQPRLAVAAVHAVSFPGQVTLLSPAGEVLAEYWHSGPLTELAASDIDRDGRLELLAGGTNHAQRSAELVVLDPDNMNGCSREPDEFQFLDLGPPVEELRLVFARTCFARHIGSRRNRVSRITAGSGQVSVEVEERPHAYPVVYHLRYPELRLAGIDVSPDTIKAHDELFEMEVIDHPWGPRDMAALRDIKILSGPVDPLDSSS